MVQKQLAQVKIEKEKILQRARHVLELEESAIAKLRLLLDDSFVRATELICHSKGRLVFSGIGKAGIIAKKLSATFSSLGKPSFFLHPAEAAHGDLGMVTKDDLLVLISKSGTSAEVIALLPALQGMGLRIIAITEDIQSKLAKSASIVLLLADVEEACNLGLAPTTSTCQMLALGDALAMAYLDQNEQFDRQSFAANHPGGKLGLNLRRVEFVMRSGEDVCLVKKEQLLSEVLEQMTEKRIGVAVVTEQKKIVGIFSDGDLRRYFRTESISLRTPIAGIMMKKPLVTRVGQTVQKARELMTLRKIGELPVVDAEDNVVGVLSLKDIL